MKPNTRTISTQTVTSSLSTFATGPPSTRISPREAIPYRTPTPAPADLPQLPLAAFATSGNAIVIGIVGFVLLVVFIGLILCGLKVINFLH